MANWLYKRSVASREVATDYAQGGYQLVASADADFSGLELACIGSAGTILWKKRITGMYEQVVVRGDSASGNFYVAFRDADSVQFWRILRIAADTGAVRWERQYTDTAADQVDLGCIVVVSGSPIVLGTSITGTTSWIWAEKLSYADGSSTAANKINCPASSTPLIGKRGAVYAPPSVAIAIIGALNSTTPFRLQLSSSTLALAVQGTYNYGWTGGTFDARNLPSVAISTSGYTSAFYGQYAHSLYTGNMRPISARQGSLMCVSGTEMFIATATTATKTSIHGVAISGASGDTTTFYATHSYGLTGGANHQTANPQDICVGESGIVTALLTGTTTYTGEVWVMAAPVTYDASKAGTYNGLTYAADTPPSPGGDTAVSLSSTAWTTGATPFSVTTPTTTIATSTATDSVSTLVPPTSGSIAKNLPSPMTAAFTGVANGTISGVVSRTLPKITGALTAINGSGPDAELPSLTASIEASNPTVIGQLGGTLLKPVGACAGELLNFGTTASSLPKLTATATGFFATAVVLTGALPRVTNELSGTAGGEGYADSILPQVSGILEGGSQRNEPVLPGLRGELSGHVTTLGAIDVEVVRVTAVIGGTVAIAGTVAGVLARVQAGVTTVTGILGTITAATRPLQASVTGAAGAAGSITAKLPEPTAVFTGSAAVRAVLAARLPRLTSAFPMYRFYQHVLTHVMNTLTTAVTTFDSYQYNSFAQFDGKYLAAGPNGLCIIDVGGKDSGAEINAVMRSGQIDFGSPQLKRMSNFYLAMRTEGDIALKVSTDEMGDFEYALKPYDVETLKQRRDLIGKGMRGRYWQFELANTAGCDFDFDAYSMLVVDTSRRV